MEQIEEIFGKFLTSVEFLQQKLNVSFGEALTETFDNLENNQIKVEMGAPDRETVQQLSEKYAALNYDELPQKVKVQIFTYLVLKAITEDERDRNQMPTPSVIATVFALLMKKMLPNKQLRVVDPAIGTGNLLYTVINQQKSTNHSKIDYQLYGIDNDEDILALADVAAHLNKIKIELFCQDALTPWMINEPDVILSDLPIGYYPLDDNAKNFATRTNSGHSFTHMLLIEQIIKNLVPDGYAFLLVPKAILSGKGGADFMPWLTKKVYVRAIVELPDELFQNKVNQKTILVFQNHGSKASPSEVLLTKLDSLKNEEALIGFNIKLSEWYTKNIN